MKVVTLEEMLMNSKKSIKHYTKENNGDFLEMHIQNVLNMRTVKEGTATAGAFCNKIMEIARNFNLDLVSARVVSDIFQRIALDSKHDGASAEGYKSLDWYKIADLLNKVESRSKYEDIEREVSNILNNKSDESDFSNISEEYMSDSDFDNLF